LIHHPISISLSFNNQSISQQSNSPPQDPKPHLSLSLSISLPQESINPTSSRVWLP
jgi:hypothetical protein